MTALPESPQRISAGPSALDVIAQDLQRLRLEAGAVSYAELASRIAQRRLAEGANATAARVARSTIFDAFRTGRSRINAALVHEIVLALGHDPAEAERWRRRCLGALENVVASAGPVQSATAPLPASEESSFLAPVALPDDDLRMRALRQALVVVLIVAATGLNLFGGSLVARFHLPLFLDMIGTATIAFALGPWQGAIVGIATNALAAMPGTPETVMFGLVNLTGAVIWGYGIRRFGRTIPRFLVLSVAVAVACSLVGVPLNVLMYGGAYPGHATEALLSVWMDDGLVVAASFSNGAVSIADKLITSVLALLLARLIAPLRLSGEAEIPKLLRR